MTNKLSHNAGLILQEALSPEELLKIIKENPAVVVKKIAPTLEDFFKQTEKLGLTFMDYRGGAFHRQEVNDRPTLMTVTGHERGFPIPLHGELYYQKDQPDFLFFYCVSPALLGGSTTVANASSFYEELPQSTKDFLKQNDLKYTRTMTAENWKKVYQTDNQSEVTRVCKELGTSCSFDEHGVLRTEFISQAIHGNAFLNNLLPNYYLQKAGRKEAGIQTANGKDLPQEIIDSIKKVAKSITVKVRLGPGDLLVVNNRASLHGRTAFIGKRQIFLRMGNL